MDERPRLAPGHRLGRYQVVAPLAIGGMGEVYRARDAKLARDVAVKVLPEDWASDPERQQRFEQEARATAALSHPNVLTIFDAGQESGRPYLVFELLEGMTLRARLQVEKGPLRPREALAIGAQAARGLAAAHGHAIVHRDLKPENFFLTTAGDVKLLDFGVAEVIRPVTATEATDEDLTPAPTAHGTPSYMSPEQARLQPTDARSDIFSLGTVLFELLTGVHPFQRASPAETTTAILYQDPPRMGKLDGRAPGVVEALVRRCLAKRPKERFETANDVALALEILARTEDGFSADSFGHPALVALGEAANPYPGLRSFTATEADCFFGREAEVARLWQSIHPRRLLAIIGPSGVGKSSFLHAGVLARVPPGWVAALTTPGQAPLASLAQALAPHLSGDAVAMTELVRGVANMAAEDTGEWLVELLTRLRDRSDGVLLVVDQFEELFTLTATAERTRFVALLARLVEEARVHVLLAVRDDFLIRCSEHPPLSPVFDHLTPLGIPPRYALRRAITEPAARLGVRFEDDSLVEEMLDAVEGERGALPLLAFAVAALWENRDRQHRQLTRSAYRTLGGVVGALAQHAEATLHRIGPEREDVVRELFRFVVTAHGTRAGIEREVLLSSVSDRQAGTEVLERLIDARLLVAYSEPDATQRSANRVEVIHESLLRAWPRLVRWQTQDVDGRLLRDQVRQAAHAWDAHGRSADLLWKGRAYRELELWRERYGSRLSELESRFADAMRAQDRRRKRLVGLVAGGVVIASFALTAGVDRSRRHQAAARDLAEARRLVALGRLELDTDPTGALAYARKSLEIQDSEAARHLVVEAVWHGPTARVVPAPKDVDCTELAASSDGRFIACGRWTPVAEPAGEAGVDRVETQRAALNLNVLPPDPQRLPAAAAARTAAAMWSIDGQRVEEPEAVSATRSPAGGWELELGSLERRGASAGWTPFPKGRSLFLRPAPGSAPGSDVLVGRHPVEIVSSGMHVPTATVVSVDEAREVRLWSGPPYRLWQARRGLDAGTHSFPSLDRTATRLAWRSVAERALVLWDLSGPPDAEPLLMRRRSLGGHVGDGIFLGDGRWIAGLVDGSIGLWPTEMPWPRRLRGHSVAVVEARFSPGGGRLVSCGIDGTQIWPLRPGFGDHQPVELGRPYSCYGAALGAEGEDVLVAAPTLGLFVAPLAGGPVRTLLRVPTTAAIRAAALSPDGRWAATATVSSADERDRQLYVIDRHSGSVRRYGLPGAGPESTDSGGVYALRFTSDGALLAAGDGGLHEWDPATGDSRLILALGCGTMGANSDGRRVVVGCLAGVDDTRPTGGRSSEVFVLDAASEAPRRIESHGQAVQAVAVDNAGRLIATGDTTGTIRVGSIDGSPPHLLLGATGVVSSVDFSPDGRWLAAAVGSDVWLWPVPDVTRTPLHTLGLEELIAKIGSFTNLRLVDDESAATGFRITAGRFDGWQNAPAW